MGHTLVAALGLAFLAGTTGSVARAQALATRTWVSGLGDNNNPCTRTAPCLTFGGAILKTAAGGEISALDAGNFGALNITKAITLDGAGTLAGITAAAGNGMNVNAGNNDVVILRNLEIHGTVNAITGVLFVNGKQLIIENTTIAGFAISAIHVQSMAGAGGLVISNSTISGRAVGSGHGIHTTFGNTTVSSSVITGNLGIGLFAENSGVINAESNVLVYNGVGVKAGNGGDGQAAATVRLSNNDVYNNLTGFGCGGGVLSSAESNRKGGNVGGTAPACAPTVVINQQ